MNEEIYNFGDMTVTIFPEVVESQFDGFMEAIRKAEAACSRNSGVRLSAEDLEHAKSIHAKLVEGIAHISDRSEFERLVFYVPLRKLQRVREGLESLMAAQSEGSSV